jgi:hypothetical protein
MRKIWIVGLLFASAACVSEPEPSVAVSPMSTARCPLWGCGESAPTIDLAQSQELAKPVQFHELHVDGMPNAEQISITGFQRDGIRYHPHIEGSQLVATDAMGVTISGERLTGAYFQLATPSGPYKIYITKVSPLATSDVRFWTGPASPIETYELAYTSATTTYLRPLCANPPGYESGEAPDKRWMQPLQAILYTGDRYDADHKLVIESTYEASTGWFNIACAGSALAKLHLNRHTTAGTFLDYVTSASQRQAMLKMYVSDLCGNGHTWTSNGAPLHWTNTPGWSKLDGNEFAAEALWTETGAQCLDVHRNGKLYLGPGGFTDECVRPSACPPVTPGDRLPLGGYVLSAVPFAPAS